MKLFHRLLASHFVVIVVVVLVLALVLPVFLSSYVYQQQQQRLVQTGRNISELAAQGRGMELRRTLYAMDQAVDARIWVIDTDGRIVMDSRGTMMQRRLQLSVPAVLFQGQEIYRVLEVDDLDAEMLLVGVPVYSNGKVTGAVLLLTPVSGVQDTIASVYRLAQPAMLISLVVAALIALLVSRSISQPLSRISRAAQAVAEGEFNQKVPVSGAREIRALAEGFNNMSAKLNRLEHMRRDFIASVSHELRTPMTSIRGFVQGVLDGKIAAEKQQKYLELALMEIQRLSKLVSDLLDLSAVEGREAPLNLEKIDLREVINLSVAAMEPQLAQHQTQLKLDLPNQPVPVMGDRLRLQQVLINLVANITQHTPRGSKLEISLDADHPRKLVFADNGPGIPAEDVDNIFKPFFRSGASGSGLGLAIARALLVAHGGGIVVENRSQGGSRFVIRLPETPT